MSPRVTRLAPSPTGALHLGNARTFMINWALARRNGWRIILRIEDLDTPRVKPEAGRQAIEDLRWLGIDWDEGPHDQMSDLSPYAAAIRTLHADHRLYPCRCTRAEIALAQSAPNLGDHEPRYPGTCRPARPAVDLEGDPITGWLDQLGEPAPNRSFSNIQALRILVPDEPISFTDRFAGPQSIHVQQQVGDFVIATKAGLPAYQLAVVVDDVRQGVTDVVRGDDLIPSAARQLWLYRFLGISRSPDHWHLPLVVGEDGRRLAKRHGDTRIAWYRNQDVPVERIMGWIARSCGITTDAQPMTSRQFLDAFDLSRLPRRPITFTARDHAWLIDL